VGKFISGKKKSRKRKTGVERVYVRLRQVHWKINCVLKSNNKCQWLVHGDFTVKEQTHITHWVD